jgi:hypothetical protein
MKRVSVREVIAQERKLIRELRAASPIDAAAIAVAESRLKHWHKIGKPPATKRAARIAEVRSALEFTLKPFIKPGMSPELWTVAAEEVVSLCDQQGKALKARHRKPGASLDRGEAMKTAWASRKWATRDKCAEEYGPKVGLGFAAARRHLRGA